MILGVGIDLSLTEYLGRMMATRRKFLHQFCTERERRAVKASGSPIAYANCVFAAKEAVGKAFGTGLVEQLWFNDIEISFRDRDQLVVSISDEALMSACHRFGVSQIRLDATCCQTKDFVSVVCILSGSHH